MKGKRALMDFQSRFLFFTRGLSDHSDEILKGRQKTVCQT
ncbi:hypothetical protein AM1_B0162 (plasmid) [Acaryochloris marina MBIC11017]|uniref:Uncharacterized protein n=1 Tax=Acaryochloris marina (strain MBIC 11017) TaxID=329726 RepID=A8ZL58_ACAM1|nr:hypothetical protein AM1_B0162 [Acaryochloris marina MBIC11017]